MPTVWIASVGTTNDEPSTVEWAYQIGRAMASNNTSAWRSLRTLPQAGDVLLLIVCSPFLHAESASYRTLTEALALAQAKRIEVLVAEQLRQPVVPLDSGADVWLERCRPVLHQLLMRR
jgi:hypothetical protein